MEKGARRDPCGPSHKSQGAGGWRSRARPRRLQQRRACCLEAASGALLGPAETESEYKTSSDPAQPPPLVFPSSPAMLPTPFPHHYLKRRILPQAVPLPRCFLHLENTYLFLKTCSNVLSSPCHPVWHWHLPLLTWCFLPNINLGSVMLFITNAVPCQMRLEDQAESLKFISLIQNTPLSSNHMPSPGWLTCSSFSPKLSPFPGPTIAPASVRAPPASLGS